MTAPPLSTAERLAAERERPAFAEMVESLPDPVLAVAAQNADDPSDRRLVFANAAARELLRIQTEGGPLVSAIRHPRVLEAVD
jgi:two-component system phosphate regulon sensor histidine kinase PhoR